MDIPENIDLAEAAEILQRVSEDKRRSEVKIYAWESALQSDLGLSRLEKKVELPLGRAEWYRSVDYFDEIHWWAAPLGSSYGSNPRRPVVMKACIKSLIAKHSRSAPHIANGWANKVAERYLRKRRYTCLSKFDHYKNMISLEGELGKRYHLSRVFDLTNGRDKCVGEGLLKDFGAWINGKHTYLNAHQFEYLGRLHKLLRKTERLENDYRKAA